MTTNQILRHLATQRWLQIRRSEYFKLKVIVRVGKGFVILYLTLLFCYIGYMLDRILANIDGEKDMIGLVDRNIFQILLLIAVGRCFVQRSPSVHMLPYLNLPIAKSRLTNAWLLFFFLNWWTFIPFVIFVPFWYKTIRPAFPFIKSSYWLLGFSTLVLIANLLALLLQNLISRKPFKFFLIIFLLAILYLQNFLNPRFVDYLSGSLFNGLLSSNSYYLLGVVFLGILLFYWSSLFIRGRLYIE